MVADLPIGDLVTGSSHGATSPKCCITLSILLLFTLRHLHWDQVRNKGHTFITKVLPAVTRKQILAEEMEGGKKKTNHKFLIFNVNVQKCNNIFCCNTNASGTKMHVENTQHCQAVCDFVCVTSVPFLQN